MPRPWKAIHFPKRHAMTGQGDKRACKWCGGGMEGKTARAVFCCAKCVNRSYCQANAERIAERRRGYREANVEKIAEYHREYYRANAERIAEYQREYLNNRIAAASTLSLAHTISQFTADPPNRNVTPAQDKTP